ncbi:bifunctional biotin--[acetyl-CoA-carboxylase] ligase/biotin operon repressor BirA [Streptococcus sp. DD13]|uniref:bifunctional biotin--[acetyl-CoA-carboxylase] ligase/biotin operon repressor BirA n=1 Tax=Streptococcus sp. DD13 TaxID=1777881 RepID=UPI000793013F|nr:bifunctional biotin--[acetyl-CoA-carboxylase] ligase/biotin operon repressor BirA [Streptococcus sp. DD13]KXT78370.1 Biotin-protein ligase / Biotin operon repressor [Streptococcus sp. DD13]
MKTYEKIYLQLHHQKDYVSGEELAKEMGISRTSIWKAIQQLEKQGIIIDSIRNRGYRIQKGDLLIPELLSEKLQLPVYYKESSLSTQLDAKLGLEQGNPAPALYLAGNQEAAKGRFGRSFFASPHGGIYMSLHLKPALSPRDSIVLYTLYIAAALVKAIYRLTGMDTSIKWVNDIYLGDKKIAGILTEAISSVELQTVTDLIIGIGINFHLDNFPDDLKDKATSLFQEQPSISRNQLIYETWRIFFESDPQELLRFYKTHSLLLGRRVTFRQDHTHYQGIVQEINDQGELIVQLDDGKEKILSSGEVSLSSW